MPRMCSMVTLHAPGLGAVRVMTTHLEYYSSKQRLAQAEALRGLHQEASCLAAIAPTCVDEDSPFRSRVHTPHAVLCGDFNFVPGAPEYAVIQKPFQAMSELAVEVL